MQEIEKKRGGCLTAWLILMLIGNSLAVLLYLVLFAIGQSLLGISPGWSTPIVAICSILNIIFAIAILKWRRWGVYGFGGTTIVAFVINLAIGFPIWITLMGLVGIIVLVILLRPVWKYLQ